jgi:hypothetical protein
MFYTFCARHYNQFAVNILMNPGNIHEVKALLFDVFWQMSDEY